MKPKEKRLTAHELARLLGKPLRTVQRWLEESWRKGGLEISRTKGGRYLIPWRIARTLL